MKGKLKIYILSLIFLIISITPASAIEISNYYDKSSFKEDSNNNPDLERLESLTSQLNDQVSDISNQTNSMEEDMDYIKNNWYKFWKIKDVYSKLEDLTKTAEKVCNSKDEINATTTQLNETIQNIKNSSKPKEFGINEMAQKLGEYFHTTFSVTENPKNLKTGDIIAYTVHDNKNHYFTKYQYLSVLNTTTNTTNISSNIVTAKGINGKIFNINTNNIKAKLTPINQIKDTNILKKAYQFQKNEIHEKQEEANKKEKTGNILKKTAQILSVAFTVMSGVGVVILLSSMLVFFAIPSDFGTLTIKVMFVGFGLMSIGFTSLLLILPLDKKSDSYLNDSKDLRSEVDSDLDSVDLVSNVPVANDMSLVVDLNRSVEKYLTDFDGDPLILNVTTKPDHGRVKALTNGSFSYTPYKDFTGHDSFTYNVTDSLGHVSNVATVNVQVKTTPGPVTENLNLTMVFNQQLTYNLKLTDNDGDPLTFNLKTQPEHGKIDLLTNGTLIYTPDKNYKGKDTFSYTLTDITGQESNVSDINIHIKSAAAPVAQDIKLNTLLNQAVTGQFNLTDADDDPLTLKLINEPKHGTVMITEDGKFTYTPDQDLNATDSFTYTLTDIGGHVSNTATVMILIKHNDTPVAEDIKLNTLLNQAVTGYFNLTDADNDPLTLKLISKPEHGTLELKNDGKFIYTPKMGFIGNDSFKYTVTNVLGKVSDIASVNLSIRNITNPAANNLKLTTKMNNPVTGIFNVVNPDGGKISCELVNKPKHGTVKLLNGEKFIYTPQKGFYGTDTFTYKAISNNHHSNTATVKITIKDNSKPNPKHLNTPNILNTPPETLETLPETLETLPETLPLSPKVDTKLPELPKIDLQQNLENGMNNILTKITNTVKNTITQIYTTIQNLI
jgi:VCBS repeat-containing protein